MTVPDPDRPASVEVRVAVPNAESAQRIAGDLVARELATSVQVLGPMASIYAWEGEVHQAQEWLLLARTTADRFVRVRDLICELHRYEVPDVVAVPVLGEGDTQGQDCPRDVVG